MLSRNQRPVSEMEIPMPRRDPELPEGTDQVIRGASATGGEGGGAFLAGTEGGTGTERLVTQVRDQVSSLRGQAGDRVRGFADDGKARAASMLDEFGGVLSDAAKSVDERLGEDYGATPTAPPTPSPPSPARCATRASTTSSTTPATSSARAPRGDRHRRRRRLRADAGDQDRARRYRGPRPRLEARGRGLSWTKTGRIGASRRSASLSAA